MNYKIFSIGALGLMLALPLTLPMFQVRAEAPAAFISPAHPALPCFVLNRGLKLGFQGDDVHELQVMLNSATDTQVSQSGAGSPGNETTYFGPATLRAVIKFQNKYKSDILTPVGLSEGTGYVGVSTLAHLKRIFPCNGQTGATTAATITAISPSSGPIGTTVTLSGTGFASTTRIKFGTGEVSGLTRVSSTTLSFKVPQGSGAYCGPGMMCPMYYMLFQPGSYDVSVVNWTTESNSVKFEITGTSTLRLPTTSNQ
jgi:hypothetical protein